jgi:hypothetical protein
LIGGVPVINVNKMYPAAKMSDLAGTYGSFKWISGGKYWYVPAEYIAVPYLVRLAILMLKPKSAIFRTRVSLSKIFSNLRSL